VAAALEGVGIELLDVVVVGPLGLDRLLFELGRGLIGHLPRV
jgi:hypothetical protein